MLLVATQHAALGNLSNIGNIEGLILENFSYTINVLEHIKILNNLCKIIFINCSSINSIVQLREYCALKKIKIIVQ